MITMNKVLTYCACAVSISLVSAPAYSGDRDYVVVKSTSEKAEDKKNKLKTGIWLIGVFR